MTGSVDPIETALLVVRHLDALDILHTIGGSIASSFAGEPRSTVELSPSRTMVCISRPVLASKASASASAKGWSQGWQTTFFQKGCAAPDQRVCCRLL